MATNKDDDMTEDRYYVAGDCILDRLQPELCCPFDCESHAKHALEMYVGELADYQWVRIDSLNGRRGVNDADKVDAPDDYADKFDAAADAIRQMVSPVWIEFYGERCPEFEPECLCCRKWAELDKLLENPMR